MAVEGTTGPELLVELRRGRGPLRRQLEAGLRAAVRAHRLAPGARLPASRTLARDLGVSRRLVVEAYEQLVAEGWFVSRTGAGTFVRADAPAEAEPAAAQQPRARLRYDFFPGAPDLAGFPRAEWVRCTREALRRMPDSALGYPDPRGAPVLRAELAAYLRRARGVDADPERVVVCAGAQQALALLAQALGPGARIAVEDPCLPRHRQLLHESGAEVVPIGVDADGLRVPDLEAARVEAVVCTPAHQQPTGVVLSASRRATLAAWGGLVVEDDYDAEFRFDRAPLGALQGLAPQHVAYLGSASKSLAPALRLAWLVVPPHLVPPLERARLMLDNGSPSIDQHAFAELLASGAFDRHLRSARRRYRARRDALVAAVEEHLPGAVVEGVAAGLHAVVRPPEAVDETAFMVASIKRSVGAYPMGWGHAEPRAAGGAVILGYAGLPEPAIREGVRRLAQAFEEARGVPPVAPPSAEAIAAITSLS